MKRLDSCNRDFMAEGFKQAHIMVDLIADYYKNIEEYPVHSVVKPGYLLQTLPASATELETVVMDWLASLLKLPSSFMFAGGNGGGGVIHGTTSEVMLCTVIAARERALNRIGGTSGSRLVVYASDQTHSTLAKACKLAGIAPSNIRALPTSTSHDFALSSSLVRAAMQAEDEGGGGAEANRELMEAVNRTGKAYTTHTVVGGGYVLRFAVGASLTEERHVDGAWSLVQEKAKELMSGAGLDRRGGE
ncbi:tryptophan decarboxylase TDC2-like [Nymphaea colorata]|nr:tryptophan decarboxylase TDC2-like [Nymphaea colorata]